MLVVYFLRRDSKAWLFFLVSTVAFGLLTYMIVGGTRANIIIAFAIFLFIGIIHGWISLWMLAAAGVLGIVGMFWLALKRYGMNVSGDEAFYTFLYLTRDTFSPWRIWHCCCRTTTTSTSVVWLPLSAISMSLSLPAVAGSPEYGTELRQLLYRKC